MHDEEQRVVVGDMKAEEGTERVWLNLMVCVCNAIYTDKCGYAVDGGFK